MATSYEKGISYELIAKAIFEEILREAGQITVRTEHLAELQGLRTKWVVDVLWEFDLVDIRYLTIVQAKNWNRRVAQADVASFQATLLDIPGQPRGIMISRNGFQSGAESFAKNSGILLYQLAPLPKAPVVICDYGWAHMKINPSTLHMEPTVFNPKVALHFRVRPGAEIARDAFFKTMTVREYLLFDVQGKSLGTMRDVVASFVDQLRKEERLGGDFHHTFEKGTLIRHESSEQLLPVESVTAEIDITPEPQPPVPMLPRGFVAFVMINLQTGRSSTYAIDQAIVACEGPREFAQRDLVE